MLDHIITINLMQENRLVREEKTLRIMTSLYCNGKHSGKGHLCSECQSLLNFAIQRLHYCPYGKNKPTCAKCDIHCNKPEMRDRIKEIMRYAGPRMLWRHPLLAIQHLLDEKTKPNSNTQE